MGPHHVPRSPIEANLAAYLATSDLDRGAIPAHIRDFCLFGQTKALNFRLALDLHLVTELVCIWVTRLFLRLMPAVVRVEAHR